MMNERLYDSRKLFKIDFSTMGELKVGWLAGWSRVVIIDYRYIVDILIDIVLGTSVISFKISYDVIEIIIIGILQNGASARKLKISNQLFCNCFITCTTLFLLILLVLLLKKKRTKVNRLC